MILLSPFSSVQLRLRIRCVIGFLFKDVVNVSLCGRNSFPFENPARFLPFDKVFAAGLAIWPDILAGVFPEASHGCSKR